MKHLRKINESSLNNTILETIMDILTEVVDLGYKCRIIPRYFISNEGISLSFIYVCIESKTQNAIIPCKDISDTVLRMVTYMEDQGYIPIIERKNGDNYTSYKDLEKSFLKKGHRGNYDIDFAKEGEEDL